MVGIYKITNNITGEVYIGQSKDIEKRFKEHRHHKKTLMGQMFEKYGIENFSFDKVIECAPEDLDYFEQFFIRMYKSNEAGKGYNRTFGGKGSIGTSNPTAKLTEEDVYDIRESYRKHEKKGDVYERYKDKVKKSYFSNLWEGYSWPNVHYDVYTPENLDYYSKRTSMDERGHAAIFSNEEVKQLRERYINETASQIYESVKSRCSLNALQQMLWGRTYKNVPVYNKRTGEWVDISEGCIDYPSEGEYSGYSHAGGYSIPSICTGNNDNIPEEMLIESRKSIKKLLDSVKSSQAYWKQ